MKKALLFAVIVLHLLSLTIGCVSTAAPPAPKDVDAVIREAALQTARLVEGDPQRTLAVYYITTDGEQTALGDYITQGLTTEIANLDSPALRIVSRQAVDRIMEEYKYQLSELVDRDTQVEIGRQIGADLILTGFLAPGASGMKLNLQLIETATALVLGGVIDEFLAPGGLGTGSAALAGAQGGAGASSVVSGKRSYPESFGTATATTMLDDFSGSMASLSLGHFEEYYGDRVLETNGSVSIETDADGNGFALYAVEAELEHVDFLKGWNESDASFYLDIDLGKDVAGFDGVAFGVLPSGFSRATVMLKKETASGTSLWQVPLALVPGKWQEIKVPFSVFISDAPGVKPSGKLVLELVFGLWENVQLGYFSDDPSMRAGVSLDDVGLYRLSGKDAPGLIEAFEDDVNRFPAYGELYGARYFQDYRTSDEGVFSENKAVKSVSVSVAREGGGPKGGYLAIRAVVELEKGKQATFADIEEYLIVRGSVDLGWSDYSAIGFLARSNVLERGTLEIHDASNDAYYSAGLNLTGSWGRQLLTYDKLQSESGSLATASRKPGRVELGFSFEVPKRALAKAVDSGRLEVELFIDELYLLGE
jgi:TolB-like protein